MLVRFGEKCEPLSERRLSEKDKGGLGKGGKIKPEEILNQRVKEQNTA